MKVAEKKKKIGNGEYDVCRVDCQESLVHELWNVMRRIHVTGVFTNTCDL